MISGARVVPIEVERISFETTACRHHTPGRPVAVPFWAFTPGRKKH